MIVHISWPFAFLVSSSLLFFFPLFFPPLLPSAPHLQKRRTAARVCQRRDDTATSFDIAVTERRPASNETASTGKLYLEKPPFARSRSNTRHSMLETRVFWIFVGRQTARDSFFFFFHCFPFERRFLGNFCAKKSYWFYD